MLECLLSVLRKHGTGISNVLGQKKLQEAKVGRLGSDNVLLWKRHFCVSNALWVGALSCWRAQLPARHSLSFLPDVQTPQNVSALLAVNSLSLPWPVFSILETAGCSTVKTAVWCLGCSSRHKAHHPVPILAYSYSRCCFCSETTKSLVTKMFQTQMLLMIKWWNVENLIMKVIVCTCYMHINALGVQQEQSPKFLIAPCI